MWLCAPADISVPRRRSIRKGRKANAESQVRRMRPRFTILTWMISVPGAAPLISLQSLRYQRRWQRDSAGWHQREKPCRLLCSRGAARGKPGTPAHGAFQGYAAYRSRQAAFFRRGHPAHRFPPCQADKCLRQSGRRDLQDHRRHHPSQYSLQLRQLFQIFSILMPPKPL